MKEFSGNPLEFDKRIFEYYRRSFHRRFEKAWQKNLDKVSRILKFEPSDSARRRTNVLATSFALWEKLRKRALHL